MSAHPTTREGLTFDEFHDRALPLITPDNDSVTFWAAGLGGEVGEVFELFADLINLGAHSGRLLDVAKKIERGDARPGRDDLGDLDQRLKSEAGNVLFYLRQILNRRGLDMQEAALAELDQLASIRAAMA